MASVARKALNVLWGHPLARGLDIDAPGSASVRRRIVETKPFLRLVYEEWYDLIKTRLPELKGPVLELGALGGFMEDVVPDLLRSDILPAPGVDIAADARMLPLPDQTLRAIVMTNVFHHIPDAEAFLDEADRTLQPGGRVVMIEPWNNAMSRFFHQHFHHEAFEPDAEDWKFPSEGPLSDANGALAWIVIERDRSHFERLWPQLQVIEKRPIMPFRYALSGGVSFRSFQPGWTFDSWRKLEDGLDGRISRAAGLLALVVIGRH